MTERLLQYIWQLQYFNQNDLRTAQGETLVIIRPGTLNTNQGPDFVDGRIRVNDTTWVGNVELHIQSSNWADHDHSNDPNYNNVILHVVWNDDVNLDLPFPVLELQAKVSKLLLNRFDDLMNAKAFVPCEKMIHLADPFAWITWKQHLLVERLEKKIILIAGFLAENNNHWDETFWWLIARNFGVTVNCDAFESIARSLPLHLLGKHKNQLHQAEALLFGQAGLLETDFSEDYPTMLKKEYQFYKSKYKLKPVTIPSHFLRMRPSNFPTVRLAQLAMLIHKSVHLFSLVRDTPSLAELRALMAVTANDYWHYHYSFGEPSAFKEKKLGAQMIDNLLINTVVPIVFAYGHYHKEQAYKDRALEWLEQMKAERNHITNGYMLLGVENKSAFDSQALIQLKHCYCDEKRCLECGIGNRLLKPSPEPAAPNFH
jgi:hypothetical protein